MVGRPRKYFTEAERKQAIQQSKNKHISNKDWICTVCDNHNYKLTRKWNHLNSIKHKKTSKQLKIKKHNKFHSYMTKNIFYF